jgi:flagellar hook-basal body complex protein FliE
MKLLLAQSPRLLPAAGPVAKQETGGGSGFAERLNNALHDLNQTQLKAEKLTQDLLTGEVQDLHQVTIALQEARLTMQLAVEVRNKVVEAYQEVARMQV